MRRTGIIAATFWIGGLWFMGLIVAPILYRSIDPKIAGVIAGNIFAVQAWIGLVCGIILLVDTILDQGLHGLKSSLFWLIVAMLICTLVNQFAITPVIVDLKQSMNQAARGMFGGGFATWHAISSLIYLLQSMFGMLYIWKRN